MTEINLQAHARVFGRGESFPLLVDLVQTLLSPSGCSWDRAQTLESLKPFLIEEAYEVLEAMDANDASAHAEELGDLLFQIVFQAELRSQTSKFSIDDVCVGIVEKMKRRHPHIFETPETKNPEAVKVSWQQLKEKENLSLGKQRRTLDGIPRHLPALLYAHQLGERAAAVGFDWPDVAGVREKVAEEMSELDEAIMQGDKKAIVHELGDVLFTLTRLAGQLNISAEEALRTANARFIRRFHGVEDLAMQESLQVNQLTLHQFNQFWQEVKKEEKDLQTAPLGSKETTSG